MSLFTKRLATFKGGAHPKGEKYYTADVPIKPAGLPEEVVMLMAQHIGGVAKPLVKKGDQVLTGQLIGEATGFVSANIHASVSGEVVAVKDHESPLGGKVPAVTINSDGRDSVSHEEDMQPGQLQDAIFDVPPSQMLEQIFQAGIVGLGGAAFPTHVKLKPPPGKQIDTVILNGAECEPYLTADHRVMREAPELILKGLVIIMRILDVSMAYIGIEDNKQDAIQSIERAIHRQNSLGNFSVNVVPLKTKYPQGGEKQLIFSVLGRKVPPPPGLPMDVGVVVQNVSTALAIAEAVIMKKPLYERVMTISGAGISKPGNFKVRIGTPVSFLFDLVDAKLEEGSKLIMGGPMMGLTQWSSDVPVIKGTSGILVMPPHEVAFFENRDCIRCGECVLNCPMGLVPTTLVNFCKKGMFGEAELWNIMSCIECGTCAYACPARIPLVHYIKLGKSIINQQRRKKQD